jgi:hypothetical protein
MRNLKIIPDSYKNLMARRAGYLNYAEVPATELYNINRRINENWPEYAAHNYYTSYTPHFERLPTGERPVDFVNISTEPTSEELKRLILKMNSVLAHSIAMCKAPINWPSNAPDYNTREGWQYEKQLGLMSIKHKLIAIWFERQQTPRHQLIATRLNELLDF